MLNYCNLPSVKGTMYSKAGWPCPSIKFKATYVMRRPTMQNFKDQSASEDIPEMGNMGTILQSDGSSLFHT